VIQNADIERRLAEAEAIIRACVRLEQVMYDSDMESAWPTEATELLAAYEAIYDVDFYLAPNAGATQRLVGWKPVPACHRTPKGKGT
jgi:hypothetical protein